MDDKVKTYLCVAIPKQKNLSILVSYDSQNKKLKNAFSKYLNHDFSFFITIMSYLKFDKNSPKVSLTVSQSFPV